MTLRRREFLAAVGASATLGSAVRASAAEATPGAHAGADLSTWAAVRDQFLLDRSHIHMAMLFFASHPAPVREAIERHRRGFDANPVRYFHENIESCEAAARASVAAYVGGAPEDV